MTSTSNIALTVNSSTGAIILQKKLSSSLAMWTMDLSPSGNIIGMGGTDNISTQFHVMVAYMNAGTGSNISLTNLTTSSTGIYEESLEFLNDTDCVVLITVGGYANSSTPSNEMYVYLSSGSITWQLTLNCTTCTTLFMVNSKMKLLPDVNNGFFFYCQHDSHPDCSAILVNLTTGAALNMVLYKYGTSNDCSFGTDNWLFYDSTNGLIYILFD